MYKQQLIKIQYLHLKIKKDKQKTDRPDDRSFTITDNQPNGKPIEAQKPIDPLLIKPKDNFFNFVAYNLEELSGGVT